MMKTQDGWNLWKYHHGCFMQLPGMWQTTRVSNLMMNGINSCPSTGALRIGRLRSCSARSSHGRWIFLLDALGVAVNLSQGRWNEIEIQSNCINYLRVIWIGYDWIILDPKQFIPICHVGFENKLASLKSPCLS